MDKLLVVLLLSLLVLLPLLMMHLDMEPSEGMLLALQLGRLLSLLVLFLHP